MPDTFRIGRALGHAARVILSCKTKAKMVVFESDDWGAIRTPTPTTSVTLGRVFKERWQKPFYVLDSLESSEDLDALFQTLRQFRDRNGAHPKLTANTIVANPDFAAIERSDFGEFNYERFVETLKRERGLSALSAWRNGIEEGLIVPQLHGREHIHGLAWLRLLRAKHPEVRAAFLEQTCHCPVEVRQAFPKENLSAALNIFGLAQENDFQIDYLKDSAREFRDIFGFESRTFTAPSYLWNSVHEATLKDCGIKYLQGIGYQYAPSSPETFRRIFRYLGQRNTCDQWYLVRNAFFEPSLNPGSDSVSLCLKQVERSFRFGMPAIIGSHRVNFIGSLSPQNRARNLRMLHDLLSTIIRRWPDVIFSDSPSLAEELFADQRVYSRKAEISGS